MNHPIEDVVRIIILYSILPQHRYLQKTMKIMLAGKSDNKRAYEIIFIKKEVGLEETKE